MQLTLTTQQLQGVREAFAERPHLWLPHYSRFGDIALFIAFLDLILTSDLLSTPRRITLNYGAFHLSIKAYGTVYAIESAGLTLDTSQNPFWYIQQAQQNGRRFTETDKLMPFVFLSESFTLEMSTEQHHFKTTFAGDAPVNAPFHLTPPPHEPYISIDCTLLPEYSTKSAFSTEEIATLFTEQWKHLNLEVKSDIQWSEDELVIALAF